MKKSALLIFLLPVLLFTAPLVAPPAAAAAPAGHAGSFGGGHAGSFSGGHGGGGAGRFSGRAAGGGVGRFEGRSFGGHHEGRFHGGGHFEGGVWIGPGWGWWDPFYYPYYYPYYDSPSVVVPEAPQEYIAPPQEESGYWYYCKESNAYYPYVKVCPGGWLRVVPSQ